MNAPTSVIVLTPPGRGAVATIRIEGPQATALVSRYFSPANGQPLEAQPPGKILFGQWGEGPVEEREALIVARRAADAWEVHCHGGAAAVERIVAQLVAAGGQSRTWTDWLAAREPDPIAAEAQAALTAARTERVAGILLDQWHGALRLAVEEALYAAEHGDLDHAARVVRSLLHYESLGKHLTAPWRVVLAGRPNVGKSSLINALVGYQRSIVFDQPGTTRDVVTASTAIDGWPVELADTAGLRAGTDAIEIEGVARAEARLAAADVVILVFDATAPWTDADQALAGAWPAALRVWNKSDLAPPPNSADLATSALTAAGLAPLLTAISHRLVPHAPDPNTPIPFTPRQTQHLHTALHALATDAAQRAQESLGQVVGDRSRKSEVGSRKRKNV